MKIKCKPETTDLRRAIMDFATLRGFRVMGAEFVTEKDKWPWVAVHIEGRLFTFASRRSVVEESYEEVPVSKIFEALETPPPVTVVERKQVNKRLAVIYYSDGAFRVENTDNGMGLGISREEACELITRYEAINP